MTLQDLIDQAARKGIKPCNIRLVTQDDNVVTEAIFTDSHEVGVDWHATFHHVKE